MSEDTQPETGATASSVPDRPGRATLQERSARLQAVGAEARGCTRCPQLVAGRTHVVFGTGDPDADLMFVGGAPGAREDAEGVPFVGAPGRLLDELLAAIGLTRDDVYVTTVLKCSPPGNRDASPTELARCRSYLDEQVALVEPRVICTFGTFATRLLRGGPETVRQVHGEAEVVTVGGRTLQLLPLFHPSAALYTRALRTALEADVLRLPELVARPAPPQPTPEPAPVPDTAPDEQLGLF